MEFQTPFEFATIEDRINDQIFEEHFEFLDEGVLDNLKDSKFYKDIKDAVKKVEKIFREELKKFGDFNKSVKHGVNTKGQTSLKDINVKTVDKDKIDGHGVQIATYKDVDDEMINELKGRVNNRIKEYGKITSHKTNNKSTNSSAPKGIIMFVYKRKPLSEQEFENPVNQEVFEESVAYNYINEAHIKRSEVKDEDFGVPSQKKFPMTDAKHVKSAIKFFNYVDKEHEKELARNIKKKMQQFGISDEDIKIGDKNRFKNYLPKKSLAKENQFHGEANSHIEFESALFGEEEVVTEGVKEIIESIKKWIVETIRKIINGIKKILGLDKVKSDKSKSDKLNSINDKAEDILEKAKDIGDNVESAKKAKEETESFAEQTKKFIDEMLGSDSEIGKDAKDIVDKIFGDSVENAKKNGVPEDKVLKNKKDIDNYFQGESYVGPFEPDYFTV